MSAFQRMTASPGSCPRSGRRTTRSSCAPGGAVDWGARSGREIGGPRPPPADPQTPFECDVQIRAHADPVPAVAFVRPAADTETGVAELVIRPVNPLNGVSPG